MSYQAPGVYIEYVTSGPLTIRAASTSTTAFIGVTATGGTVDTSGDLTPVLVTSVKEYADLFATNGARSGAVNMPTSGTPGIDHMGHAIAGFFANGGAKAYVVSNKRTGTGNMAHAKFKLVATAASDSAEHGYVARALSRGKWGDDLKIKLSKAASTQGIIDIEISLALASDAATPAARVERFLGIPTDQIATLRSSLVTFEVTTETIGAGATLNTKTAAPSPLTLPLSGGVDSDAGGLDSATIFDRLKDIDDISLIVLPGKTWSDPADKADYTQAIAHAQAMKDRMVLIQVPDSVTDWDNVGLPVTPYASAYYPSAKVANRNSAGEMVTQTVGLTGHVAGIIARTDQAKGAWTAAAGTHAYVGGIAELTRSVSQVKQEPINRNNVNAIRLIAGMPTVYGARTRDRNGIYEYQPVMRTAFLIADSLREALGQAVFAKNTEVLWGNLKLSVSGFLQTLYAQGAFQGASPSQAYEVACGLGENMVQADIDSGLLRVTVRFRAAKPAEFIEVSVEQLFADSL